MNTQTTKQETISIRPAESKDFPTLSRLLVQLYMSELPGVFSGSNEDLSRLLQFTLETQPEQALQNRIVLCDSSDSVLASGMIQLPTQPLFDRAPSGTISMATKIIGYRATSRLLFTVARSRIAVYSQNQKDTAVFHSIVVDEKYRRQGLGQILLKALEQNLTKQGYQWASLQVLANNKAARNLYLQNGYEDIWHTPRWVAFLSWHSYAMRKALIEKL